MLHRWSQRSPAGIMEVAAAWSKAGVRASFSFRTGGVSKAPWQSLNLGYHVGDDPARVEENRRRWSERGFGDLADWVVGEQVHGNQVAVVDRRHRGAGSTTDHAPIAGCDALVTNEPGLTLVVLTADCVPILFHDPVRRVVAAAHSGWRGTVSHIAVKVVERMSAEFGSRPEDLRVALGPSIRRCCYEVDEAVAGPVRAAFGEKPLVARHGSEERYWLSLQACIRMDLLNASVLDAHIDDVGVCTACHREHLFSHRAEAGKTGRQCGAIVLSPP
ncbi:MAG: peptidoglycan editing factor PgeF [Alicyclobacillus sp.]|nr:peptidoglycan editing factor PgeF [Alicyclobacillus sp.]